MKIILLKDVAKVGRKFDVKDISDGYAINLLIPKGLAISATPEAIKRMNAQKEKIEGEKKVEESLLIKNINELDGKTITIVSKANNKGHLFAGLHKQALLEEIEKSTRMKVDPQYIEMEHPIKEVGKHELNIKIGNNKAKMIIEIKTE